MEACDLSKRDCVPCRGGVPPMEAEAARGLMGQLHGDWVLDREATVLARRFAYKGFAKAVQMANVAAWLGDREGHHPDICFGWGYCEVRYTTHEIGGLSENDFICAAKLDVIVG